MKRAIVILVVIAVAFTASCYRLEAMFDRGPVYTERVTQEFQLYTPESYKIGVGDVLEVTILAQNVNGEPTADRDLVRNIRVLPDGTVNYLYNAVTAEMMVAGKTAPEVAKLLEQQLVEKSSVVSDVHVSVNIVSSVSAIYYVAGEVKNPGAYSLDQPVTVIQAIVRAGWFTEFADRKHIQIVRREGDREIRMNFNYTDFEKRGGRTKYDDIMLHPNDTILVSD